MSSTFSTPIRIFKRNNPSNDGTIAPDNTGASMSSQQVTFSGVAAAGAITTYGVGSQSTTADSVVIPAGSIISDIKLYETTAPSALTSGVITVAIGATTIGTITATATNGGLIAFTPSATAAAAAASSASATSETLVLLNMLETQATPTMEACERALFLLEEKKRKLAQ